MPHTAGNATRCAERKRKAASQESEQVSPLRGDAVRAERPVPGFVQDVFTTEHDVVSADVLVASSSERQQLLNERKTMSTSEGGDQFFTDMFVELNNFVKKDLAPPPRCLSRQVPALSPQKTSICGSYEKSFPCGVKIWCDSRWVLL